MKKIISTEQAPKALGHTARLWSERPVILFQGRSQLILPPGRSWKGALMSRQPGDEKHRSHPGRSRTWIQQCRQNQPGLLNDMDNFAAMNAVYAKYYATNPLHVPLMPL